MRRPSTLGPHRGPTRRIRIPVFPIKVFFVVFVAAFMYMMVRFQELDFEDDVSTEPLTRNVKSPRDGNAGSRGREQEPNVHRDEILEIEKGLKGGSSFFAQEEQRIAAGEATKRKKAGVKRARAAPRGEAAVPKAPPPSEEHSPDLNALHLRGDAAEAVEEVREAVNDKAAAVLIEEAAREEEQQEDPLPPPPAEEQKGQEEEAHEEEHKHKDEHKHEEEHQQPPSPPPSPSPSPPPSPSPSPPPPKKHGKKMADEKKKAAAQVAKESPEDQEDKEDAEGDGEDAEEDEDGAEAGEKVERKKALSMQDRERQNRAELLLAMETDPQTRSKAYAMRELQLKQVEAERLPEEVFAPVVTSVHPTHGPREGGTVALLRGSGFGRYSDEITVSIGGVPCEQTRWLSPEAVSCLTPKGSGTSLAVKVVLCSCSEDPSSGLGGSAEDDQAAAQGGGGAIFSYDEDALKEFLDKAPMMDIKPPDLALQLHRGQLLNNSGSEAEFFNYITGGPDFYSMLPAMSQVLPVGDVATKYETCAVVGKSASLIGSKMGFAIDEHEAVFRFDNSPTAFKFATDVGRRTRYQVINTHWANSLMSYGFFPDDPQLPRVTRWWIDVATVVLWGDMSQSEFLKLRYIYPTAAVMFLSRDLITLGQAFADDMRSRIEKALHLIIDDDTQPSSQLYAVLMALQMCNKVRLYGFESGCVMGRHKCLHTYYDESEPSEHSKRQMLLDNNIALSLAEAGFLELVRTERKAAPHVLAHPVDYSPGGRLRCDAAMCLPPCSGNGVYFNGTCHCRKMYSGAACELDHLELNADDLLQGINLGYTDDILLHQGAVEWLEPTEVAQLNPAVGSQGLEFGGIPVPPGIINNRTEVGNYYMVDKRTYNLLPQSDAALFENWIRTHAVRDPTHESRRSLRQPGLGTCALVGNSGQLLSHQYGIPIDDHDVVYRFNQAPVAGFKGEVGSRCTHEGLNSAWMKLLVEGKHGDGVFGQHRGWNWRGDDTGLMLFELFDPTAYQTKNRDHILQKEMWWKKSYQKLRARHPDRKVWVMSPKFVAWAFQLYQEFEDRFENLNFGTFRGEKPMSGYYAIMYALQVCSEVDVYGFTPYQESDAGDPLAPRYHYFDEAVPRHNSHSFDLTQNMYRLLARQLPYFRIFD